VTIVVTVLPDGARFPVREGETMLAAARRYGYGLPVGCREGGCGGCVLELVGGDVVYRKTVAQSVLSDRDRVRGICLPCRAVPVTDTVIRLNRTDRLGRGPFSDRLALKDLENAGRVDAPDHVGEQQMSVNELAPTLASITTFHEREADLMIERRENAAEGVVALTLADPSGADLPEWSPGAHVDLVLSPELTRQYSLCGSTRDRRSYRIGVLRDPKSRGGSEHVHEQLQEGGTVRVRGPRNHFAFIDSPEYLFIAGGIGITPMLPMIASAEAVGANWRLVYGGRNRDSMAFLDELAGYGDRVTVHPQDEVGHIPLSTILAEPRDDVQIYSCGPGPLLDALESTSTHWPSGSLHTERFAAKDVQASAGALDSFDVVCQRSGVTLKIGAGQSILDAADKAGIKVLSSCRAGVCGTCDVDVLDGQPDHRDSVLSAADKASNEFMLVCISRSLSSRLVLDM
jgi:ferredoxin-NADP reductase